MYKNPFLIAFFGLMIMTAPFFASAETVPASGLQAQIQSLLARVHDLELQFKVSSDAAVSSPTASMPTMPAMHCYSFARSLSTGTRGDDVTELQQFLMNRGFSIPAGATGYFGSQTRVALANWQEKNDVAATTNAGSGIFGPLSRGVFSRMCNSTGGPTGTTSTSTSSVFSFTADPQSGSAPLSTTFTASTPITGSSTLTIDFGDKTAIANMNQGSCIGIASIVGGQGGIRCSSSATHTYKTDGTYIVRLIRDTCPKGALCFVGPLTIATTVVTVGTTTANDLSFSATPQSGVSPLAVQFKVTAPQGTSKLGNMVDFGDGTTGMLGFAPTCSSCDLLQMVSHTYTKPGTYHAQLEYNSCKCAPDKICNCPLISVLGSTTVTVASSTATTSDGIVQLNAPGVATLAQGGIAEIRNKSAYFTLTNLTSSSATIQVTGVGCWNSFPSDVPPEIHCMIAVMPIAPQTLSVGQTYSSGGSYSITLTKIADSKATFSVTSSATAH